MMKITGKEGQTVQIPWKGVARLLILVPLMLAVLLISAGSWSWWEAWAYTLTGTLVLLGSRLYIIYKQPDLALERSRAHELADVKEWDKYLMPLTALVGPFASWIVAGLDHRLGWTPDLPNWIQIAALALIQLGSLLGTWAMAVNRFFSSQVRIQSDRGQKVIEEGPYRFVRHPGYAGGLVSWLAAPVFFSSWWVAVVAVLTIAASVARTALEDRVLQDELPGYREYAEKVRYRLIPGIW
ncbi:MAG: methyltransferase family protein [Anaerolineales bacterium]